MKGSPETITTFCDQSSINQENYQKMIEGFTNKGLRVIAFAAKDISENHSIIKREEAEQNMRFLGLLVLENKLKSDTASVILSIL